MTHAAIIVPPNLTEPHHTAEWEGRGLLPMLYREMGVEPGDLDARIVCQPDAHLPGGVRLYSPDRSLLVPAPAYNDRAIVICRYLGYAVPALAGTIVFIGCPPGDDETGLHPHTAAWLDHALTRMTAVGGRT